MRQIIKNKEPIELTTYKKIKDAEYDGPNFTPVKAIVRSSLLNEQGFLCAYCMRRINFETMKIEHWACQQKHPNHQLDYANLLACCLGHEGCSPHEQTCDTLKGSCELKFSPANSHHRINDIIRYDFLGEISSTDDSFNMQINKVLNLNKSRLKLNRREALKVIQAKLAEKIGSRKSAEIQKLINIYNQKNIQGKFFEYYGIIIYYLQKKFN